MRALTCLGLLHAACSFDSSTRASQEDADLNAPDADPNAPDADLTLPDADLNAPDADPTAPDADMNAPDAEVINLCGWDYNPEFFDPCAVPNAPIALDLNLPFSPDFEPYTYDTTAGVLRHPDLGEISHTSSVVLGNRIIWTSNFNLATVARLRPSGSMPLIIVSTSTIDIGGAINAGSFFFGGGLREGPGSEPAACTQSASGRGEDCKHGGAGGGGGAFAGNGGRGGNGALDHNDCNAPDEFLDGNFESTGGSAGLTLGTPAILRGGCAGKEGGEGDGGATFGVGGPGGGAIHFTAATTLTVTGSITVGGAGGLRATGSRAAGGGGGSGGMIGVEAVSIELITGAVLASNGGGGGGGGNGGGAQDGDDAPFDTAGQALGGAPESQGTRGGNGGWVNDANGGSPTPSAQRGGGGGGGAAGYILYYQDTSPNLSATISPAAIAAP